MAKKKVKTIHVGIRESMIMKDEEINIIEQCKLLEVRRSSHYYKPVDRSLKYAEVKLRMVDLWNYDPCRGCRQIKNELKKCSYRIGKDKVSMLMSEMGLKSLIAKLNLSKPNKEHKKYPYLLRGVKITHPNHVWSTDITYINLSST